MPNKPSTEPLDAVARLVAPLVTSGIERSGERLNIYTAEPGSPPDDALNVLASWINTPSAADAAGDR